MAEESEILPSIFFNQVGGHSCILKISGSILKPYNENEEFFYESVQKDPSRKRLLEFLPKYHGVWSLPLMESQAKQTSAPQDASTIMFKIPVKEDEKSKMDWLSRLHTERFRIENKYLKLQDITENIEKPCILDLKIGFQAYNDEKFDAQSEKMRETTSSSLGLRITGLSVNQKGTKIFKDKYWGRLVGKEQFSKWLSFFFFDGEQLKRGLVQLLINKVTLLIKIIKSLEGFKFFSSSLLIVYDASLDDSFYESVLSSSQDILTSDRIHIKIIDFAKTRLNYSRDPDTECIEALENLRSVLSDILLHELDLVKQIGEAIVSLDN